MEPGRIRSASVLYRLSAFATHTAGWDPAGAWVGDALPDAATMQGIACDVGYSETAFVAPASELRRVRRLDLSLYPPQFTIGRIWVTVIARARYADGLARAPRAANKPSGR